MLPLADCTIAIVFVSMLNHLLSDDYQCINNHYYMNYQTQVLNILVPKWHLQNQYGMFSQIDVSH